MRRGIFGGTFDPMHHGHIHAVAFALVHAQLDECRIVVAGEPWQKDEVCASAQLRLTWAQIARDEYFEHDQRVLVDDREVRREGPSYTSDTLRELHEEFPEDTFVLVVGEDIPTQIPGWKNSEDIEKLAEIFSVPRSVFPTSSSYIRECVQAKKPITGLLPFAIEAQILANSLYNKAEVADI